MGLFAARNAGIDVPDETVKNAMDYIRRSTGKDGSVAYSGNFSGMGGSINLTAIGALTGAISRSKDSEAFQNCLTRLRANLNNNGNSGHPEYFAYYMAQALFQSDYSAWQTWNAGRIKEMRARQTPSGSFEESPYMTGMYLLSLALNYRFLPIYER